MNQDWEWEDLLDDKPVSRQEPEKKPKAKSGTKKKKTTSGKSAAEGKKKRAADDRKRPEKEKTPSSKKKDVPQKKDVSQKKEASPKKDVQPAKEDVNPLTEGIRTIDGEAPSISGSPEKKTKGGKKKRRKKKKSRVFLICYAVFVLLLVAAGAVIVRNVYTTMEELHANTPETFIRQSLGGLTNDDVLRLFKTDRAYETETEAIANIRSYLQGDALSFQRIEHNEYEVYNGERKLFEARLNARSSVNKLGLLNYDILESCAITPIENASLFRYEIKAPSTCEITVNGKPVQDAVSKEDIEGFADALRFTELPTVNTYVIDGLTKEPEIRAIDNGQEMVLPPEEKIDLTSTEETEHGFSSTEEAGIDFDALEFARQWTMFNRNDLTGDLHGYYTIEEYLVPDSQMCTLAYQYATSQDIGWTSNHVLLDPPFTEEQVSHVRKYDENTASVDVALKMHMLLDRGSERTDSIHTTLYLIKLEGEWKVINTRDVE